MKLTNANYFGKKSNQEYMSVSQLKAFLKCPAAAMAELNGKYEPERGRALLLGSYVDEALTGTKRSFEKFCEANRDELYQKRGDKKYADIIQADEAIRRVREQPRMMQYLGGKHQVIMTGEIEGVPFKIKMDSYKPGEFIADLKYTASLRSPNLFEPLIKYWGYDIQAACYQEIVRQNTGKVLPFYFVVATKEKPAHLAVGHMEQMDMDEAMEKVRNNIVRIQKIKTGELPATRCRDYDCDYCTSTGIVEVISTDLFGRSVGGEI